MRVNFLRAMRAKPDAHAMYRDFIPAPRVIEETPPRPMRWWWEGSCLYVSTRRWFLELDLPKWGLPAIDLVRRRDSEHFLLWTWRLRQWWRSKR